MLCNERAIAFALLLLPLAGTAWAQDAHAGKKVFGKCMACHDAEKGINKVGPTLKGVIGRTAGTEAGFNYSAAMKAAGAGGLVWNEQNLSEYLADPKAKVPGNRMAFAAEERSADQGRDRLSEERLGIGRTMDVAASLSENTCSAGASGQVVAVDIAAAKAIAAVRPVTETERLPLLRAIGRVLVADVG